MKIEINNLRGKNTWLLLFYKLDEFRFSTSLFRKIIAIFFLKNMYSEAEMENLFSIFPI
jgi:hypothetical protein